MQVQEARHGERLRRRSRGRDQTGWVLYPDKLKSAVRSPIWTEARVSRVFVGGDDHAGHARRYERGRGVFFAGGDSGRADGGRDSRGHLGPRFLCFVGRAGAVQLARRAARVSYGEGVVTHAAMNPPPPPVPVTGGADAAVAAPPPPPTPSACAGSRRRRRLRQHGERLGEVPGQARRRRVGSARGLCFAAHQRVYPRHAHADALGPRALAQLRQERVLVPRGGAGGGAEAPPARARPRPW